MLFKITTYLRFLMQSTNQHGVHSPFVFDLITKCLYKKTNAIPSKYITTYRNRLLQNSASIVVKDFGKGSKIFKSNKRAISKIAKVAGISAKRANLLIRLVEYFKPNHILELGTSLGIGTAALKLGNSNAQIDSLEGCPEILTVAQEQFNYFRLEHVNFIEGDFDKTLGEVIKNNRYDLIYIDGNHQKKPTLNYFEKLIPHVHNDSLIIFDDIHWSKEMEEAWELIKNHPKVTITIDSYFWGFVFFRKEQAKEHFNIRI